MGGKAVIAKSYRLGGFNNRRLFWRSESKLSSSAASFPLATSPPLYLSAGKAQLSL
jgi:hypothetical protein